MSTSRDVLKFGAAAAVTGLVATEFQWATGSPLQPDGRPSLFGNEDVLLPDSPEETITLPIGGRQQEVRPLSFYASLPPPFDADIYVWGYHVQPAVTGPENVAISAELPTGDPTVDLDGDRVSLTPILRHIVVIDEGIYHRARPDLSAAGATAMGRKPHDASAGQTRPSIRLADPVPGASSGGLTPDVSQRVVLVEVEKGAGLVQPVMVNSTRWEGSDAARPARPLPGAHGVEAIIDRDTLHRPGPIQIWESCNLVDSTQQIHLLEFRFVRRHALGAVAFNELHDLLWPGAPYPCVEKDAGLLAGRGTALRPEAYISCGGPGGPSDDRGFLPSPGAWDALAVGGLSRNFGMIPAFDDERGLDDVSTGEAGPPVSLSGLGPGEGPGYVWHCLTVSRHHDETGCPHRFFTSPPTVS